MVKEWEDVQADICRLYVDGKPLKVVRAILQRERGFIASERAYRQRLKKWKVKRIDKRRNCITPSPPVEPDQGALPTVCANSEKAVTKSDILGTSFQQPRIEDSDSTMERRRHRNTEILLPHDEKFDKILQEISEAPSECFLGDFLYKEDICSKGSTLPHYIAARGRLDTVLVEAIHFSMSHGYCVDTLDKNGFTALHIAVRYDRLKNVKILLTFGAQFDIPSPYGELPLHVAITCTKDTGLFDEFLFRHDKAMHMRICGPSERAGMTALDLVVERALREVSLSGDVVFTPTANHIISLVLLKSTGDLENTKFIEELARTNHTSFKRATTAIAHLPSRGAQRLAQKMSFVVREECRRHCPGYCPDAHYDRLLPSAWKRPNYATLEPAPTMRISFPPRSESQ